MIVKILEPPKDLARPFDGVRYNTNKVMREKGELMAACNFGAVAGLARPRPQDYINYLETWSNRSNRIKNPQFHVVISAKGREMDKHQLCELAEQWLAEMGYGDNPYLLIFHKDTNNNHLHVVTSRIGTDGKKIDDSFERKRAYEVMNRLLGVVPQQKLKTDLQQAFSYGTGTRAQFLLLLEAKGYRLKLDHDRYHIYKYGKTAGEILLADIDRHIAYQPDKERLQQLRAIVNKYQALFNPELYAVHESLPDGREGKVSGYASELTEFLKERFGLQFCFHGRDGKQPYGYTLIDHAQRTVYKGGLLMALDEFTSIRSIDQQKNKETDGGSFVCQEPEKFGAVAVSGTDENELTLAEASVSPGIDIYVPPLRIDIANDIDDEQVLGRNRRRKRKARTNTR